MKYFNLANFKARLINRNGQFYLEVVNTAAYSDMINRPELILFSTPLSVDEAFDLDVKVLNPKLFLITEKDKV